VTNTALSWLDYGMSKLGIENDPAPAWKFYLDILGVIVGEFTSMSGLSVTRKVELINEGGTNDYQQLLPGKLTHGDVTLSRGITYSRELWRWFSTGSLDGQVMGLQSLEGLAYGLLKNTGYRKKYSEPKKQKFRAPRGTALSIILGNTMGMKVKHWDLIGAIPVKWTGPELKTDSNSMAIEQLTIAYHRLDLSIWAMTPMGGLGAMIDSAIKIGPPRA
jgi:phage tail-like protein